MSFIVIPPEENNDADYFIAKKAMDAKSAVTEVMEYLSGLHWSDNEYAGVWLVFDMNDAKRMEYKVKKELVECAEHTPIIKWICDVSF